MKNHETVKTEVIIESKTGNKVFITNDQNIIRSDVSVKYVTQNILAQLPELIGTTPIDVQTTTYGTTKETVVVFMSEEKK